jgi:hypothetical protein
MRGGLIVRIWGAGERLLFGRGLLWPIRAAQNAVFQSEAVIHAFGKLDIVGDHYRRESAVTTEVVQQIENKLSGSRIEITCRFVGQQQCGIHNQGPGKSRPLLFTA